MYSIMQGNMRFCYLCQKESDQVKQGKTDTNILEEHFIFGGRYREKSKKYGLVVFLHKTQCHREGVNSVHKNNVTRMILQGLAQEKFEEVYRDSEKFTRLFGKDYLWGHYQKNGVTYSNDYDIPEVFDGVREDFEALNVKSPNENIYYNIDTK